MFDKVRSVYNDYYYQSNDCYYPHLQLACFGCEFQVQQYCVWTSLYYITLAVIFPSLSYFQKLPHNTSVFIAELLAIKLALQYIKEYSIETSIAFNNSYFVDFDIFCQNFYTASNLEDFFHNIHPKCIIFSRPY